MWSNTFAKALDVRPEPSRRVAWLLCALHGLSVAGVLWLSVPAGMLLLPLAGASLVIHLRRAGWLGGSLAVVRLYVAPDGKWRITDRRGHVRPVRVSPASYCSAGWCLLQMRDGRKRRVVPLTADSVDSDTLRRLRARLMAVAGDTHAAGEGIRGWLPRIDILDPDRLNETLPMPTDQERLESLLSDDPDHVYSDDELDAIEAMDAEMALRIDRVQTLARRQREARVSDDPVDEARVREAVEEARGILMQDGGDIEFVAIDGRTVRVRLKGACVGCPRSALDLRNVVERLVRAKVPGVAKVVNEF